ncbi:tail fiber protein [Breoghania sp. L-A4]|uniref:phage tail protein n=1 Tax=Breoghania sp. L-A4 TaxID=2304600 RepID=UPI000E358119|nr:tail fiber protein [Breoghania sp. L-A4]AXS39328.1 phage tail protein [Breoghania sp. L-A4]
MHTLKRAAAAAISLSVLATAPALAQTPYIGQVETFSFDFCPEGWMQANGQLLAVSNPNYQKLFSLIGTLYGGDGTTVFALPDLRGRVPISAGQGPDLSTYRVGESGGEEAVTLTTETMPRHTHSASVQINVPAQPLVTKQSSGQPVNGPSGKTNDEPVAVRPAGGDQPHENRMPYLALTYCVNIEGTYPKRD